MTFPTGFLGDPQQVGSGQRFGQINIMLSAADYEDGLKIGLFARVDVNELKNMDGSGAPVIAGVVDRSTRYATNAVAIDKSVEPESAIDYMRSGLITVQVKTGETPAKFGEVFASNAGDAFDGQALAVQGGTGAVTDAEFIEEISTDVWLIRLK